MIKPTIFRDYDIRGIVGKEFDSSDAKKFGQAFGTLIQEFSGPNIIVGRDNRFTSDSIASYFISGVLSTGCNVVDVGLALRPMIQAGIYHESFDGGAMITGSHSEPEYNGIKFFTRKGKPFFGERIKNIKKLCYSGEFKQGNGEVGYSNLAGLYYRDITQKIELKSYKKVVIDCGNGTAGKYLPHLFHRLGCDVVPLYTNLDGSFPNHTPNPENRVNMLDLSQKVLEEEADLGIAFDTDGDRFGIIDEKGNHHASDRTLVLLARKVLENHPQGKIIFDVKCSYVLEREIKKARGTPIMIRTGHPYFYQRMEEDKEIVLGGELSGHFLYQENNLFDDAAFAAAKILKIASEQEQPLSESYDSIPKTAHTPEIKASCPDEDKFEIVEEVRQEYEKELGVLEYDGARVIFSKTAWALIRASNTTPCLSLRFEAKNKKTLRKIMLDIKEKLKKYPQVDLKQLNLFLEAGK
ncbi:MAG: phosphomannomutase/phosphoglucomutase [Patescibacteria group bacterium]